MRLFSIQVATVLAMLATVAFAESPFEISGFSTDLTFSAAVEKARARRGNCRITPAGTQEEGIVAQCEFAACSIRDKDGACDPGSTQHTGLSIASQPILRMSLEARTEAATVTRIFFIFDGQHDAVQASLYETYGPPDDTLTPPDAKSWSRARRMTWTRPPYLLGLSDVPKLISLAANPTQK